MGEIFYYFRIRLGDIDFLDEVSVVIKKILAFARGFGNIENSVCNSFHIPSPPIFRNERFVFQVVGTFLTEWS